MSLESLRFQIVPPARDVEVYDFAEATLRVHEPIADPFRAVTVTGRLAGAETRAVGGFCDAQDGSVYRVRWMPAQPGAYSCAVTFRMGEEERTLDAGSFTARASGRKGMLRVHPEYPWHFQWAGDGEPFFWLGATAYLLAGCAETEIAAAIDRLAALGVNRIRVALCPSRQKDGGRWFEPQVMPDETFSFCYGPWPEAQPDSLAEPRRDVTRFDVAYWRKYERLLAQARARDMIVQVIFFVDGQDARNYPFDRERIGDDPDERRYYAYALARLGAFSNVEWCLTNEWALYRPDAWAERIGAFLDENDPYGHLTSVHGHGHFPFRASAWADFAQFQSWDEHGGYAFMRKNRQEQEATGRPMPQINEEYGYEDHYPGPWGEGRKAPARAADTRRRLAWEITMAGAYQTTGESAASGAGGWVNGRGDAGMTMLRGYAHLKAFFTAFAWWKLEPRPDLAGGGMCLAEPGARYVLYLPEGWSGSAEPEIAVEGARDAYAARWYDPRAGQFAPMPDRTGDWVYLLETTAGRG